MSELGKRQKQLVRALVAGGPLPPGFDRGAVDVAAAALRRKRAAEVAVHIPSERAALGERFAALFDEWATGRPKSTSVADALAFLEFLRVTAILERPPRPTLLRRLSRRTGSWP